MTVETEQDAFRHEAILYAGVDDFVERVSAFVQDGLLNDEPTMVVLTLEKLRLLREKLGSAADRVVFADMDRAGRNPARIIPVWREFVDSHRSAPRLRGVGEPAYAGRSEAELDECSRHEALLNRAFEDTSFWLACPYDTRTLGPSVIDGAVRNHPLLSGAETTENNARYEPPDSAFLLASDLPEPPVIAFHTDFDRDALETVRAAVEKCAGDAGLSAARARDAVLATNEAATNSLLHGGGTGTVRIWFYPGELVCEVRDRGLLDDPLTGRVRPSRDQQSGFGLWLVNQICDLVQLRSGPGGTRVRMTIRSA